MRKSTSRTQVVECRDCKVVCSPDNRCACCKVIEADRDREWD